VVTSHNPALKALGAVLFVFVSLAIIVGILWITRQTIYYHFDVKIFPFGYK